jgi:hypothetical protein
MPTAAIVVSLVGSGLSALAVLVGVLFQLKHLSKVVEKVEVLDERSHKVSTRVACIETKLGMEVGE